MTLSQGGREGGTKKNVIKQTSREREASCSVSKGTFDLTVTTWTLWSDKV